MRPRALGPAGQRGLPEEISLNRDMMDEKELARQGEGAEVLPERGQTDKGMGAEKRGAAETTRSPGTQAAEEALKA